MSETPYDPDDPAFLASRSLDEELSASDRQRLDETLAASESLRAEVEELRAVDGLVKRWRTGEVGLDWAAHRRLIEAKALAGPQGEHDRKLDQLLAQWADHRVEIDDEAFTAAVMARVSPRPRPLWRRNLVFRLGTPLAAAAAVAIVVLGTLRFWSSPGPHVEICIGPRPIAVDSATGVTRVAIVSFRREPGPGYRPEPTSPRMSFMAVGVSPAAEHWSDELPPL